jgi:protein TonB
MIARKLFFAMCMFWVCASLYAQEQKTNEPAPPPPTAEQPRQMQPIPVSHDVAQGLIIKKVQPKYPKDARNMRIQGPVVLQVVINDSGGVKDIRLATGHPLLAPAAIDAVKQWKFRPYELNGKPVEIVTMITLNFQLH